jgi:hypothetical protein
MKNLYVTKIILILLLIISFQNLSAFDLKRNNKILSIINQEINEINKIIKRNSGDKTRFLFRLAEINLEKARILKDIENFKYLSVPSSKRFKVNKTKFFKRSIRSFKMAQKIALNIAKTRPTFNRIGEVYFILGYNAKEFGEIRKSKQYFKAAIKKANNARRLVLKSQIALAEIFYNERNYQEAIKIYRKALKNPEGKWWTKDAFNMAWCEYRLGNYQTAISLMNKIHNYSKKNKYIDMSQYTLRDLSKMYASISNEESFFNFILSNTTKPLKYIVLYTNNLLDRSKVKQAQRVITRTLNLIKSNKIKSSNRKRKNNLSIQLKLKLLNIYFENKNFKEHSVLVEDILKNNTISKYDLNQRNTLMFQSLNIVQKMQKNIKIKSNSQINISALNNLLKLDPRKKSKYIFYLGETYFYQKEYKKAISYYATCVDMTKRTRKGYFKKCLNYIITSLDKININDRKNHVLFKKYYLLYTRYYKKSKRSDIIFQKLFQIHSMNKNISKMENTLYKYKTYFKNNKRQIQAMLADIMAFYQDKKQDEKVIGWINKIKSGQYKVTKKYLTFLNKTLTKLKFNQIKSNTSKGNIPNLIKGYISLYNDKNATKNAKKKTAYNLAVLYYEKGEIEKSSFWAIRSLRLMKSIEIKKFQQSYNSIATEAFNEFLFNESFLIFSKTFKSLCSYKIMNKNVIFKNLILMSNSNQTKKAINRSISIFNKFVNQCNIKNSFKIDTFDAITETLVLLKRWKTLLNFIVKNKKDKTLIPGMIHPLYLTSNFSKNKNTRKKSFSLLNSLYLKSIKNNLQIPIEGLNSISKVKIKKIKSLYYKIARLKLRFPETKFNKTLEKGFGLLDNITQEYNLITKIGSGKGYVEASYYLILSYNNFINKITKYTPKKLPTEYITSFKNSMKKLVYPIQEKANEYYQQTSNEIEFNTILSKYNYIFSSKLYNQNKTRVNYLLSSPGILMDRKGTR